jgi:putative membrane protein
MTQVTNAVIALVAGLHGYFLVLEMFLWDTPFGRRTFNMTAQVSASSKVLAANQGLYNGFLAAGLVWSLLTEHDAWQVKIFFLSCVVVAGIYGGITASRKIFFVQALPGLIGLVLVHIDPR